MTRLGELLIEAKLLDEDQISDALRLQVVWGGRLGTILTELGYLDLDTLSRVLGWQCSLPAALNKHFEHADRELQRHLSPAQADRWGVIPLVRVGKRVVIASMSPLDEEACAEIAHALGVDASLMIHAIAAELRIRYQLERVYSIERPDRYVRADGTSRPGWPRTLAADVSIPHRDSELDTLPIPPVADRRSNAERRTYLPRAGLDHQTERLGRGTDEPRVRSGDTLASSLNVIRGAGDRSELADVVMDTIASFTVIRAAAFLVVRGRVASSCCTFQREGARLAPISVALDEPGLARALVRRAALVRAASGDLIETDYVLLHALGEQFGELVLVPVNVGSDLIAILALAVDTNASVAELCQIADAAGVALDRLMRDAIR